MIVTGRPPKVKIKADIFDDEIVYTIRSTSLTAALERATIILHALGDRFAGMEYTVQHREGKKSRHYISICA